LSKLFCILFARWLRGLTARGHIARLSAGEPTKRAGCPRAAVVSCMLWALLLLRTFHFALVATGLQPAGANESLLRVQLSCASTRDALIA